jgi:hypothetical protein
MAFNYSPKIVTDGLVLYLDAANPTSYTSGSVLYKNLKPNFTPIISTTLSNQNSTTTLPQYSSEGIGSFIFNGTGSAIRVLNNPQTSGFWPQPLLTLEAWFKTPGTGSGQAGGAGIFGFTYGIRCWLSSAGTILTSYNNSPSSSIQVQTSGENYYDNKWHHVVSQTNGNTTYLYVDGRLRGQTTNSIPWTGTSPWPTDSLNIGRDNNNNNYFFSGSIGPIKVYNRVITAQEILQNYNATKTRFGLT